MKNPFITSGYEGPELFCDRLEETANLTSLLTNGNNVVLMSPRRIGKTGLLCHFFNQPSIKEEYNTFLIDIYATSNLEDFIRVLGQSILSQLASRGETTLSRFATVIASLRPTMSLDEFGKPKWSLDIDPSVRPEYTLDKIFKYLESSDKPNIVAIDEFQQITFYPEKNVEATLRTYIQHCRNTSWIFSGSSRHLLSEIFASPSRPFYCSTSSMSLGCIPSCKYTEFAKAKFNENGKNLSDDVVPLVYNRFEGVTWFMQKVMNRLFSDTLPGETCDSSMVDAAIKSIIDDNDSVYADLLHQLTSRQKSLLLAINREGKANAITGGRFLKKYGLSSTSTVQAAAKSLVDKQIITNNQNVYEVYDRFFSIWLATHC